MYGKMFGGRQHPVGVMIGAASLQAENGGRAHLGDQVRVLAVGFFGAPLAGVAGQVQHGRQRPMAAAGAHFGGGGGEGLFYQGRVPGGGQADGLREAGGVPAHQPVQRLVDDEDGDAQPGFVDGVVLDGVGGDGRFPAAAIQSYATNAAHTVGPILAQWVQVNRPLFVLAGVMAGKAENGHLGQFFVQCHTRQQVGDTLGYG